MITVRHPVKYLDHLLYLFYIIFFISFVCAYRGISSTAIGCILVTGLIKNRLETGIFLSRNIKNPFMICSGIFYLLQAASLLYTHNLPETMKHLQVKSGLVLIPLAVCCSTYVNPLHVKRLMKHYIWIVSAAILYCLVIAFYRYYYLHTGKEVFFYHELVTPFRQHAVQVSVFLFIGMIYLVAPGKRDWYLNYKGLHFFLVMYFMFCIVLLSSKLVIILSALLFIYQVIDSLKKKKSTGFITITWILICASIILILVTGNPVSNRFREIISGNISMVSQKNFSPGIYFNGLQFRLLQWRFVSEILNENHAWLVGVSPGDAQTLLDEKYISTNMYLGDNNNSGFLGYNTHNQLLESALQSGILGLLSFIGICFSLIMMAIQRKSILLSSVVILLLMYGLNESYFETQYGIIIFTFFPLFFYYGTLHATKRHISS